MANRRPDPPQRGRLLFADDVLELFGHRKSRWWVVHSLLPSKRIKVGRDSAWWERDLLDAIDANRLTE